VPDNPPLMGDEEALDPERVKMFLMFTDTDQKIVEVVTSFARWIDARNAGKKELAAECLREYLALIKAVVAHFDSLITPGPQP